MICEFTDKRSFGMFWDKAAALYDLFENIYNGKVYAQIGRRAAEFVNASDNVLECACGTGAISAAVAEKCKFLTATDYSDGMLRRAEKKLAHRKNVRLEKADITQLSYADNTFDKVVAGNVIHLLPDPEAALKELVRVCKPGGLLIIPTYIDTAEDTGRPAVRLLELLGLKFSRRFDEDAYAAFFRGLGYQNVEYYIVEGRMACDIAVVRL